MPDNKTKTTFDGCSDGRPLPRFTPQSYEHLLGTPHMSWIIKKLIPRSELVIIYGESGCGKSFLTLDLVMAIARGLDWLGHKTKQGRVVYICAESATGFIDRVKGYVRRHGLDPGDIDNFQLIARELPNFLKPKDTEDLAFGIGRADVVVVDTLARATAGGDENNGQDMGAVIGRCQDIHRATGAVVILVHHSGKDASKGSRGWSGIKAAADTEIYVEKSGETHKATIMKQKDGPEGETWGFDLIQHTLGQDEDGGDITTCVYEPAEHFFSEKPKAIGKGKWQRAVYESFLKRYRPTEKPFIPLEDILEEAALKFPYDESEGKDRRREYTKRALDGLIDDGVLILSGNLISKS